ncbi:putative ferric reductase transmembrane component [Hypsizygus marmoreus]|uniref:ferric-chelate reductase (NADPH) n=1 Tax=Hypsizygus marmoreus TaxID=39966 RepID=A0A369JQ20_HYPMA|nr:putative ferric reductase transmembrane component [Hypsizygus marmoreus]
MSQNVLPIFPPLEARATTASDRLYRSQRQAEFVKEIWYFIACSIVLLACIRAVRFIYSRLGNNAPRPLHDEKKDTEAHERLGNSTISVRRLPLALATAFRIIAFRWTIVIGPYNVASISEVTFIIGYMAAIFVWLLVDTRDLQSYMWQDRAAHFAASQLPLVVGLAGKNNIISLLTGVSHERLNVLHRAAARTCLILVWMHALTRTVAGLPPQFDFSHNWMRAGAVGLTAFSLATVLAIRPIRHMAFEFFLVSHVVLIAIFLICGYFHAREQDLGIYIWPAMVLWASDRVSRLARILWNNRLWSRKSANHSTATFELLAEDTIRLTLRRHFRWTAGQHAYVILPSISTLPTEAHPFSIASIPEPCNEAGEVDVVFLIRGRTGFTQRLKNHATRHGTGTVSALLDGPYGYPPDLRPFSTCILIAGGSGVSYTLPLFLNLIRVNAWGEKSAVRRIVFIWAVRDGDHLNWISKTLTEALNSVTSSLSIEPRVYITGPNYPIPEVPFLSEPATPSSPVESEKVAKEMILPVYSSLKLIHGRPSIRKLLHEEIGASLGPVSVDVAGPSALTESVRRALRSDVATPSAVLRGLPPVTLHVENFGTYKS